MINTGEFSKLTLYRVEEQPRRLAHWRPIGHFYETPDCPEVDVALANVRGDARRRLRAYGAKVIPLGLSIP